ncbi:OmpG family monomeric porin [Limnobaculum parvum]|uniref:Porin n=1 Tax=Limnobaculum parvum TaxID=2172103 RepID=A0A2Y9TZF5_9GAMM|nr:OmpG family monomeric porin [Limnobaculum parvum]AWH88992.1 porin [Limnobaculum parvum]
MKKTGLLLGLLLPLSSVQAVETAALEPHQDTTLSTDAALDSSENNDKNQWRKKIGAMIETENVEGQGDKDGAFEPTVYLNMSYGKWDIYGSFYQEDQGVDYSSQNRTDWFDQYELDGHYQFIDDQDYALGLMLGFRNYVWHYEEDGKNSPGNTQRYTIQPDWRVTITPKLSYNGWAALFNYYNHTEGNGYLDKELEGETGLKYAFNDTVALQVNYYLKRGWNLGDSQRGEYAQQEVRAYVPLTFNTWSAGATEVVPYARRTLDTYHYNEDRGVREKETDTRFGLLLNQELPHGFAVSLEYAYELQLHDHIADDAAGKTKYHYTGVGISYSF